ncbi:MAG: type II toxin-antitoxin system death-on-curing family toxin [Oscillatoriales cyanobacterium C42_A2020_001]|nr:type II toxin-antitoxin system death-on-curing family toxin [Leptolyngbyaceae cyanobacterium C42_A2020_001]
MIRYLTLIEVLELHRKILEQSGGALGIRDMGLFVDGNKRTGHAATETFLVLNGLEINASVDEQERIVLAISSGKQERQVFIEWLQQNTTAS